jgi:transmembrane sensor
MEKDKAKDILERYSKGLCTDEEKAWVETYYNLHRDTPENELSEEELMAALNSIEQSLPVQKRKPMPWPLIAAAAACLIVGLLGWWLYIIPRQVSAQKEQPVVAQQVIVPGGNKAILTLANGQKISLTDAANGNIAKEAGISITKTSGGQVVYRVVAASSGGTDHAFNTIETPVGGQYQVELPDGTKIWLNSKSSLRFPARFSGTERRVEMTGEAYFEVAHNKEKPFRVFSDNQIIEVLGTHFNINAYHDEDAVKTTLLEGAVKILATGKQVILKPGQQSQMAGGSIRTVDEVNTADIIAWKNNKIQFTDLDIHSIMRMLARWYDIDVNYSGREISTTFGGSVSRSKNIDVILKLLEATGDVHFKIEGRRVTVMP